MSGILWWCSAQGVPWEWTWRPYAGVWVLVGALMIVFRIITRARLSAGLSRAETSRRSRAMAGGLIVLWLALDWPLGALGAGYLASAHMVQYVLISLVGAPLLARALLAPATHAGDGWGSRPAMISFAMRPPVALLVFATVSVVTHLPNVVDYLMVSQLGAFAIDALWIAAALLLWAPIVEARDGSTQFPPPVQILYLFAALVPHIAIAAFLVLSPYPLYGIFELAPPTGWISAREDQQIAGVIMWVVAPFLVLWQAGRAFFRWAGAAEAPARVTGGEPVSGAVP